MIAAATWLLGALSALAGDAAARPNVVFVLIDDLRFDEIDYPFVELPNIQRLAREGVRFRNAFVTTPLCSPSRASFLTGQYAHTHGITDNTDRSPRSHSSSPSRACSTTRGTRRPSSASGTWVSTTARGPASTTGSA
jgi:predicted AlkP superfamily pyrophosphatase or phosphodiesterase